MCETMASIPIEDNSSYVLTEDMIDAAMTEQFSYQDDIESEEELSSQDENVDVDQGIHCSSAENVNTSTAMQSQNSTETDTDPETNSYNSASMSVLVIETGLDKSKRDSTNKNSDILCKDLNTNNNKSDLVIDQSKSNSNLKVSGDLIANKSIESNVVSKLSKDSEEASSQNGEKKLPILKKILSDKPMSMNKNIESIDLCDSETDEFSEDELTEIELIDDELKSVMESNLMAEVGITVKKQKSLCNGTDSTQESSPPKIAVKSIEHISSNAFSNIPDNTDCLTLTNETSEISNNKKESLKNGTSDLPMKEKEQVPSAIHINKIAVPHQTFVNSQGQKMKCVYVKNPTSLPLVINSNQPTISNKNIKYMFTSQVKKGPLQMSPIAALTNMAKQNLQIPKSIMSKPTKMLSVAPKLQKSSMMTNISTRPHQLYKDQNLDSIIKSLLFHNLKKPYIPPQVSTVTVTYACMDCSDRFILQSSLSQHLARRSMNIRYWCRICKAELQFFNRCVLLKHVRGHNNSIKHIDTTCITFSPIAKETVDNGIASAVFKECISNMNLPSNECILQKSIKDGVQNEDGPGKSNSNSNVSSNRTPSSNTSFNFSNQTLTTVAGQSKSVCFQGQFSLLNPKPNSSPTVASQFPKTVLPFILPKKQTLSVINNLQKHTLDQSQSLNKSSPKNVILLCNKLPKSPEIKQSSHTSSIPPNVICESILRNPDSDIFIDEDTSEKPNDNTEEEEIDVENITGDNNVYAGKISTVSSTKSERNLASKMKEKKPSPKSLKRFCSECGAACLNISKHLNGSNRPTNSELSCEVCQLIMPTKCALKIHLRIHMKMAPYKCPDCGKDFPSWDEVHAHLKFSCGHLAKCVRYMCVACKSHFPTISVLGHHISSKHARDIFKCTACPVAFFNKPSLIKHMKTNHPGEASLGMDYKQCSLCPKKLVPMDKFSSHVQDHTNNSSVLIYGYKCPLCSIVFANKMAFIIHQIKEKSELEGKDVKKTKKIQALQSRTKSMTSQSKKTNDSEHGDILISDSNSDFEEEPEIIRKYPELNDESSSVEKDPLSLEDWEYTQQQRVKEKREELCIVCKRNSVVLLPGIDLNDQSLCCKQCVKPLDFVESAVNSNKMQIDYDQDNNLYMSPLSRNNFGSSIKRKRSTPKTYKRSSSCDEMSFIGKKRRTSDISIKDGPEESEISVFSDLIPAKKRNRKKQSKDKLDPVGQSHIQGQIITSKSSDELVCSKCEFVADARERFRDHITVHRTDPNTFQCLECGLCFVVLPSLERHLQMHHGIKDVNSYTEKNKSSLPQKVMLVEEDTDDNQCRVCFEMFDSGSSLEKHFRTHGMAFMNSLSKSP